MNYERENSTEAKISPNQSFHIEIRLALRYMFYKDLLEKDTILNRSIRRFIVSIFSTQIQVKSDGLPKG